MLSLLLALTACKSDKAEALPTIEHLQIAEDLDPAEDVVEVHFRAETGGRKNWIDGGETPVWTYNGQSPGPLIHARVGDTLRVVFTNDLPQATTIHWHGLRIDNAMDGVPLVQQPIRPGESFTYEFVLPDAGTFWYHPHVRSNEQVERGLYGALIVQEAENIEVDAERMFLLDDVALQDNGRLFGFEINGMEGMMGRFGNVLLINGQREITAPPVQPGVVERWRVVNTANARLMYLDVRGADWRVVAIDGGILDEPYTAERLRLPIGRRFDLEVIPTGDTPNVKLRALVPTQQGFDVFPMFQAPVEGEPVVREPVVWPASAMEPVVAATQQVHIDLDRGNGSMMSASWTINGLEYGEGQAMPIQGGVPTKILVRDLSGMGHPFHLHGQFFEVLSRNGEPADVPGRLDTIYVNGDDELELFTTFDNPGLWLGHCHILEHAELGMMTSFDVSE